MYFDRDISSNAEALVAVLLAFVVVIAASGCDEAACEQCGQNQK